MIPATVIMSALEALQLYESDDSEIDVEVPQTPKRKKKYAQFDLKFKVKIFDLLQKASISDEDLLLGDRKILRKVNKKLDPIIHKHFTKYYPQYIKHNKLTTAKVRYCRRMIRKWYKPSTRATR